MQRFIFDGGRDLTPGIWSALFDLAREARDRIVIAEMIDGAPGNPKEPEKVTKKISPAKDVFLHF